LDTNSNGKVKIEFGTDGIRGVAGEYPLDPATVLGIGRAIGAWLRNRIKTHKPRVVIGHDTRISAHMLIYALSSGLLAEGIDVMDATVLPTPGVSYLTKLSNFDLGIVISASHNPVEQNGIKLFGPDGFKIHDDDEHIIENMIAQRDVFQPTKTMGYFYRSVAAQGHYINYLAHCFEDSAILKGLGVVVDCAHGAATPIAGDVFHRLGTGNLIEQNAAPDGNNINVHAGSEYVRRNREPLLLDVRNAKADIGIAFDGDADRVVFVTPEGNLIDGDHILGILALELKAQGNLKGDTVVVTDMSNSGLEHFLTTHGIKMIRTKVGDRYVMEKMREGGYSLGGEQAGHIIILDENHTTGDGIYVGLLVASLIARNKQQGGATLDELASKIQRYPQVIASAHLSQRVDLETVDGLKDLKDRALALFEGKGRINLRFSGTEPNLLRAMVEGGPNSTMDQVIEQALSLCNHVAVAANSLNPKIDVVDCVTGAPVKLVR
jgi:phosphoglucosamine mutase